MTTVTLLSILLSAWAVYVLIRAADLKRRIRDEMEWQRLMRELDRLSRGEG